MSKKLIGAGVVFGLFTTLALAGLTYATWSVSGATSTVGDRVTSLESAEQAQNQTFASHRDDMRAINDRTSANATRISKLETDNKALEEQVGQLTDLYCDAFIDDLVVPDDWRRWHLEEPYAGIIPFLAAETELLFDIVLTPSEDVEVHVVTQAIRDWIQDDLDCESLYCSPRQTGLGSVVSYIRAMNGPDLNQPPNDQGVRESVPYTGLAAENAADSLYWYWTRLYILEPLRERLSDPVVLWNTYELLKPPALAGIHGSGKETEVAAWLRARAEMAHGGTSDMFIAAQVESDLERKLAYLADDHLCHASLTARHKGARAVLDELTDNRSDALLFSMRRYAEGYRRGLAEGGEARGQELGNELRGQWGTTFIDLADNIEIPDPDPEGG